MTWETSIPTRKRLDDWEMRLFTFLNETRRSEIVWGQFDCAIGLVNGAVLAQTGEDLSAPHLGKYSDEKDALRYLRDNGWGFEGQTYPQRLTAMMDSFLRRAKSRHRGNIVLLDSVDGVGFGVRVGPKAYAFSKIGGLDLVRIPAGAIEWAVT